MITVLGIEYRYADCNILHRYAACQVSMLSVVVIAYACTWTNLSWQDEPWAKFSTLEGAACHAMHLLHSIAIRPNLELKTQPKQILGYLPLDIAFHGLL